MSADKFNNLHITLTPFEKESRVLKETESLIKSGLVNHIFIVALHAEGLKDTEVIDSGRSVWRIRLKSRNLPRGLFIQIFKYLEFGIRVIIYANRQKIRMVNIHHLSLLPLGVIIKLICRAKLVYDTHELETETFVLRGMRKILAKIIERTFIKFSDIVIVVSDGINEWYRKNYNLSNSVSVLNCPLYQKVEPSNRLHQALDIPTERKIVIYIGGIIRGRGIEQLLESFSGYDDKKHVMVFLGYGELEEMVKQSAKEHENIYFHPGVKPSEVLEYAASADIGVSYIDNPSLNDHYCLPNKLFESIMAGLPVIVNDAPEMKKVVTEQKIGIVLKELTAETLKAGLEQLSQLESEDLSNNLKEAAKKYSWKNQAKEMISAYNRHIFT